MNASTRRETTAAGQHRRRAASRLGRDLVVVAVAASALLVPLTSVVHAQEDPEAEPTEATAPAEGEAEGAEGQQPPVSEAPAAAPAAVGELVIEAGDLLLADQEEGRVLVIDGEGDERPLIEGLAGPRGVVVLEDGSFVVAESAANRIVGIGGRFGATATVVAEYPFAGGMALVDDQTVVVTSYSEGRLSTVDLATGTVTDVATGLVTPSGVAQRNGTVYVAELNNRRVVSVDPAGQVVPVVEGVAAPVDVALGQGSDIYVVDPTAGTLTVASGGEQRVLSEVVEARAVTTSPTSPLDGEQFELLVAGSAGVVSVDPGTGATQPVSATVGIGSLAVLDESVTRGDPGTEEPVTPGSVKLQGLVETDGASSGEPSGSPLTVIILAILILGGLGAFLALQFRRVRRVDDDEEAAIERFDVRPLDETFGPCVNEELEVERAQAALASAAVQIEALRRRDEGGADVVAEARNRLAAARAAREELRTSHPDRVHPIHEAAEMLSTDDGREALEEYRSGAISPLELARRWRHAEEAAAIAHVRDAGDLARVADLTVPGPLEREAAAEVAEAEADVAQARHDLERLLQREQQLRHNLLVAEASLEACRLENPVDQPEGEHHDPEQAEAWASPPVASVPVATSTDGPAEDPVEEQTDEAALEEPVVEEPVVEEPVVGLVIDEPVVDKPVAEPLVEESVVEAPPLDEPALEEAPIAEPVVEELSVEESLVEESLVEESLVEESVVEVAGAAPAEDPQAPLDAWVPPLPQGESDAPVPVHGEPQSNQDDPGDRSAEAPKLAEWESPKVTPVAGVDRSQSLLLDPGADDIALPGFREKRIEAVRAIFDSPHSESGVTSEPWADRGGLLPSQQVDPTSHAAPEREQARPVETTAPTAPTGGDRTDHAGAPTVTEGAEELSRRSTPDVSGLFAEMDPADEDDGDATPAVLQWYAARKARRIDVPGLEGAADADPVHPEGASARSEQDDGPTVPEAEPPADAPVDTSNLFRFPSRRRRR